MDLTFLLMMPRIEILLVTLDDQKTPSKWSTPSRELWQLEFKYDMLWIYEIAYN